MSQYKGIIVHYIITYIHFIVSPTKNTRAKASFPHLYVLVLVLVFIFHSVDPYRIKYPFGYGNSQFA
jgi:uncharacterized integral membrane protein